MQHQAQVIGNGRMVLPVPKDEKMPLASALSQPRPLALLDVLARAVAQLRQARAQHRAYVALMAEFDRMTDADWFDLGLSRHNARDLARHTVYGR